MQNDRAAQNKGKHRSNGSILRFIEFRPLALKMLNRTGSNKRISEAVLQPAMRKILTAAKMPMT
jgi:hypothetical protein